MKLLNDKPFIIIINKCDLPIKNKIAGLKFSCKKDNINLIMNKIINVCQINKLSKSDMSFLQTTNEIGILNNILNIFDNLKKKINKKLSIDLLFEDLYSAYKCFNCLFGEDVTTDFLDKFFKSFCVGK